MLNAVDEPRCAVRTPAATPACTGPRHARQHRSALHLHPPVLAREFAHLEELSVRVALLVHWRRPSVGDLQLGSHHLLAAAYGPAHGLLALGYDVVVVILLLILVLRGRESKEAQKQPQP